MLAFTEGTLVLGGYFLVQGHERKDWKARCQLPATVWTVDPRICDVFPDSWVFSWAGDRQFRDQSAIQDLLGLSPVEFSEMQAEFDAKLLHGEFGFPCVLFTLESARGFHEKYLGHVPRIKLLSTALPEERIDSFLESTRPSPRIPASGVRKKLQQREMLGNGCAPRGFEVLGFDGAVFNSFMYYSLEQEYGSELSITLNENGLIDLYEDALQAARYTVSCNIGFKAASWEPWLICEHSLGV